MSSNNTLLNTPATEHASWPSKIDVAPIPIQVLAGQSASDGQPICTE